MMAADKGSPDTLRLQFKAMQELQHRRLQKQMEKKKELSCESRADDQEEFTEIPDGLSLLNDAEDQNLKNIFEKRVLEDEIQQLRDELRETVDESGRLHKLLKERDFEIKHLKKKIEEDRFAFTGTTGMAGDLVATKIVELSKKNRGLMAESESAKARVKQLTNRIQELELELQMVPARPPAKQATDVGAKASRNQKGDRAMLETTEVKALQDRLAAMNLKMSDLRNQIQSVKQELRMAQKVLANEVGEDVNIQQLLSSPGTWRGRAQQILVLQSKVRELEKQLGQRQSKSVGLACDERLANSDPRKLSAQEKNLLRIRSLERDKQESWEKLASERDTLQTELEALKKKFEGMRSRNKVLSSEAKTLRSQMMTLVEKGRHDDELIDTLVDQLKQLQEILGGLSVQEESRRTSQHHRDQKVNNEAQRSTSLVAQLRAMVAEREAKVRQLEVEIGQLSVQYLHSKGAGEGASPTHSRIPEDLAQMTKSPASAGDHVGQLGSSRVEESSSKLVEAERRLQEERQRAVLLEQHLEKMRLEPARTSASQKSTQSKPGPSASSTRHNSTGSGKKDLSSTQLSDMPMESQIEELTARLAIQMEENGILRAALGSALRGKEEDFRMYHQTLGQVKGVFLQALRQQKANK
ncbi:coiled-coil domain-containing protein 13 isoform X3 [Nannospalax galili]|uniref:coiled-coil domain-containing protein 13 isoform X3 n=1 Tax=Nannospalax galili TaxID=1026970 RepID=UPI0004ED3585|nr:coiled-coil domain-containing protein 13 isoform X3 [Nannospalax galili]